MNVATMVLLQGLALASSLFGYFILAPRFFASVSAKDLGIGGGLTLLTIAATYGWWPAAITASATGIRGAYLALVVLDLAWAFLGQGLAGFALCAIPVCPDFSPFSDVARYASLIFGAAAAWSAWNGYRRTAGSTQWAPPVTAIVLTVGSFALQAANTKFP
jgi:hypothetical protein